MDELIVPVLALRVLAVLIVFVLFVALLNGVNACANELKRIRELHEANRPVGNPMAQRTKDYVG